MKVSEMLYYGTAFPFVLMGHSTRLGRNVIGLDFTGPAGDKRKMISGVDADIEWPKGEALLFRISDSSRCI